LIGSCRIASPLRGWTATQRRPNARVAAICQGNRPCRCRTLAWRQSGKEIGRAGAAERSRGGKSVKEAGGVVSRRGAIRGAARSGPGRRRGGCA
jgi:hypothetical protein